MNSSCNIEGTNTLFLTVVHVREFAAVKFGERRWHIIGPCSAVVSLLHEIGVFVVSLREFSCE